jgi:hypothetical protein
LDRVSGEEIFEGHPLQVTARSEDQKSESREGSQSTWLALERQNDGSFIVRPVVSWISMKKSVPSADDGDVDKQMKLRKQKELREKKTFEKRFNKDVETDEVAGTSKSKKRSPKHKRVKHDDGGHNQDNDWEGNEEFSDDDELVSDEEQQKEEIAVDVEDDVNIGDIDSKKKTKNTFGLEISKILEKEKEKAEEAEETEIQYQPDFEDSDEDMESTSPIQETPVKPIPVKPQISKEEEIRARIKDLFYRNEFSLEISQVTQTFPFARGSEEYTILFKIVKEIADVVERKLYLKSQYRR